MGGNIDAMKPSLHRKHILLGVTGGIAAYKAADLCRRLGDAGASVRVVMTDSAQEFIKPLTFQALSGNPVHTSLLDPAAEAAMGHIELARWADAILVAPASANFIARLAHGRADDLLSTLCLATAAPITIAPAMNRLMWSNAATQENISTCQRREVNILGPAAGEQACGEVGEGRMLEPLDLVESLGKLLANGPLAGKSVLLTAGPTYEPIDPVRFIGNRSSGKMGYAIAEAAADAGADVTLISGPTALQCSHRVERIDVESAGEMHQAALAQAAACDIFIAVAAVADYRPRAQANQKIKKDQSALSIELERTQDILADVAALEQRPFCVGFAAETQNVAGYAQDKLSRKGIQMIAANDVSDGQAFGRDDNALHVFWPGGERHLGPGSKRTLGTELIELIAQQLEHR